MLDQRAADAFVELSGGIAAADDLDSDALLSALAQHARDLLQVDAASALSMRDGDEGMLVAGSDPFVRRLEADAVEWDEGPGRHCMTHGELPPALRLDRMRWPRYYARAQNLGLRYATALPLRSPDATFGALVLLHRDGSTHPTALALAQSLADVTAICLLREREVRASRAVTAQLEHALTSRIVIEQAKGILAARLSVPMDATFRLLRGYARHHRRPLADVARDVIEGRLLPAPGRL